jgi:hypothetical protein
MTENAQFVFSFGVAIGAAGIFCAVVALPNVAPVAQSLMACLFCFTSGVATLLAVAYRRVL